MEDSNITHTCTTSDNTLEVALNEAGLETIAVQSPYVPSILIPTETSAQILPETSTTSCNESLATPPTEILTQPVSQLPSDALVLELKSDMLPCGSRKNRNRYREQKHYYLVKFKKDSVLHVCQSAELLYQRRIRDSKIGPFAKYFGVWYECVVLRQDVKKSSLLQDMHAANKRSARVITRRSLKSMQFALVQFYPTCDYQVVPIDEVTENSETGMCSVTCPDGVNRTALLVAKGDFDAMASRQKDVSDFQNLTTPIKKNLRNPLLRMTPRVKISPLRKKRSPFWKRSLSMQSTASSENETVLPISNIEKVDTTEIKSEGPDLLMETKSLSPESLVSEQEQHDPFSTDSGSEYLPESDRSNCTSPAFSVSSELIRSLNSPINEAIAAGSTTENDQEISAIPENSPETSNITDAESTLIKQPYKRKESACLYCNKLVARISSHLQNIHKDQTEVRAAMAITNKRQKRDAWKKLRLEGNNKYNCTMLQTCTGNLILQRRSKSYKVSDYLPCGSCHGWFKRQAMYKHANRCVIGRTKYDRTQNDGRRLRAEYTFCKNESATGNDMLEKYVYPRMTSDNVSRVAQADDLIIKWGIYYCITHMQDPTKEYLGKVASQKMRQLARLLITLNKLHGNECTLKDFLVPQYFNLLLNAVRITSGLFDGNYKSASLPISLGYTLKRCAMLMQGEASRMDNDTLHKSSTRFLELLQTDWTSHLTSTARHQLKTKRFEKRTTTKLLPLVDDVMTFVKYLRLEEARLMSELSQEFLYRTWSELNKVLLCSLIVFNRKRVGDVEKIQISSYNNKTQAEENSALYESLHPSERLIATSFVHMYTRGKKDSIVPIMLPKSQVPSFDLLVKFRSSANVSEKNKFLFAKGENSFMDGSLALRQLTKQSGAKNHHLLRSTSLRKQVATLSQVMNLKEGELDIFAKYLGHSVSVHRNYYRLQDESLHLARVSRLLLAISTNNIESIRGKSLDELPMPAPSDTLDYLIQADADVNKDLEDEHDQNDDISDNAFASCSNTSANSSKIIPSDPNSERTTSTVISKHKSSVKVRRILPVSKVSQIHRPWSAAERSAVLKHLSDFIEEERLPKKMDIVHCLQKEPALRTRTWRNIKDYTYIIEEEDGVAFEEVNSIESLQKCLEEYSSTHTPDELKTLKIKGSALANLTEDIIVELGQLSQLELINCNLEILLEKPLTLLTLKELHLVDNGISELPEYAFENLSFLIVLSLENNQIEVIKKDTFKTLRNLKRLILSKNRIQNLTVEALEGLEALEELDLRENKTLVLENGVFHGFRNIRRLNLEFCNIEYLPDDTLKDLATLEYVGLDFATITNVSEAHFKGLCNVTELLLYNTSIKTIDPNGFRDLTSLTHLNLTSNCLTELDDETFRNTTCLEFLDLQNNKFEKFPKFSMLSALKTLQFRSNNITTVEKNDFYGLANLLSLDLSDNLISQIDRNAFQNLSSLFSLSLVKCGFKTIKSGGFNGLEQLTDLQLKYNEITTLESGCFEGLTNLQILKLESNAITSIDSNMFQDVPEVRVLSLKWNQINSIEANAFCELQQLKSLDLSSNGDINADKCLDGLNELQFLYLENTNLKYADKLAFDSFKNLILLDARRFPVEMASSQLLYPLPSSPLTTTDKQFSRITSLHLNRNCLHTLKSDTFEGLSCLSTLDLSNNKINKINTSAFENLTNLHVLNLAYNHMRVLEPCTFVGLSSLHSLYLSGNKIRSIKPKAFSGLKNLIKLNLHDIDIRRLKDGEFEGLQKLKFFNLADSGIQSSNVNALEGLEQLVSLDVSRNYIRNWNFAYNLPSLSIIYNWGNNMKIEDRVQFARKHVIVKEHV